MTYTPTYPDEPPELDLDVLEGEVADEEKEFLLAGLNDSANESLGMVRAPPSLLHPSAPALTRHFSEFRPWCSPWRSSSRS